MNHDSLLPRSWYGAGNQLLTYTTRKLLINSVALTGRNRTGPPCSVSRPHALQARWQRYRRRQTPATVTSLAHLPYV